MSTGPSETRKSLQALTTDVAELVNSTRPVGKRKLLELQHALEALAASEPVEVVAWQYRGVIGSTPTEWMELEPHRVETVSKSPGYEVRPLYTHPAPEQPGKGEGLCSDCPPADESDKMRCDPCPRRATPQPSDPAEGDALQRFSELLQRLRGQLADSTSDFAYVIVRDYANELGNIHAALSTPPTAAVSVDDAMVERAAKTIAHKSQGRALEQIPANEQDEYRDYARAALTAALDPQVKK